MADTIAGVAVRIRKDTYQETQRLVEGALVRAKDLTLISTLNPATEKIEADCEVSFFTRDEETAFRAAVLAGATVAVALDTVGLTLASAVVTIGRAAFKKWSADGSVLRRWIALHIAQV